MASVKEYQCTILSTCFCRGAALSSPHPP